MQLDLEDIGNASYEENEEENETGIHSGSNRNLAEDRRTKDTISQYPSKNGQFKRSGMDDKIKFRFRYSLET